MYNPINLQPSTSQHHISESERGGQRNTNLPAPYFADGEIGVAWRIYGTVGVRLWEADAIRGVGGCLDPHVCDGLDEQSWRQESQSRLPSAVAFRCFEGEVSRRLIALVWKGDSRCVSVRKSSKGDLRRKNQWFGWNFGKKENSLNRFQLIGVRNTPWSRAQNRRGRQLLIIIKNGPQDYMKATTIE